MSESALNLEDIKARSENLWRLHGWTPQHEDVERLVLEVERLRERLRAESIFEIALSTVAESDPKRLGGKPCLRGTRNSVACILAMLSEGDAIRDIHQEMGIDRGPVATLLSELSSAVNKAPDR